MARLVIQRKVTKVPMEEDGRGGTDRNNKKKYLIS